MTTTEASTISLQALPAIGAALAGGLFAGVTTYRDGTHSAVVLLDDKPSKRLDWGSAMAWAQELQAELPTRPVAALLFHHLPTQFEQVWHWTSEAVEGEGSFAWNQDFGYGTRYVSPKSYEGRARAVRLIPLTA